jgi:hypothetical protein
VEREHILQHKSRRVASGPIIVAFNVEPYHIVTLGKETFGPSTEAAKQVNCKRLTQADDPKPNRFGLYHRYPELP